METEREHELIPPSGSKDVAPLPSHDRVQTNPAETKGISKIQRLIPKYENGQISITNHYPTQK